MDDDEGVAAHGADEQPEFLLDRVGARGGLFPMVHVARPEFDPEVSARLAEVDLVVAEGVGRTVIGSALMLTYRVLPWRDRRLGLVEQRLDYAALGVPVMRPDSTGAEMNTAWKTVPLRQRLLVACLIPPFVMVALLGGSRYVISRLMQLNLEDDPSDWCGPGGCRAGGGRRARQEGRGRSHRPRRPARR